MRIFYSSIFFLLLVCGFAYAERDSTPFYNARSQNDDIARWLAGWSHQVNLFREECSNYYTFAITPVYSQTFKSFDIADALFGSDLHLKCFETQYITISGSAIGSRDINTEWLADYFGLAPDFKGRVYFKPKIKNAMLDFNIYIGLDKWLPGLYVNFFGPLVYTKWDLGMKEEVIDAGELGYAPGYFNATGVPRGNLLNSFTDFVTKGKVPTLDDTTFFIPLRYAKMADRPLHKIGFADIQAVLGYNFIQDVDYHIGGNLRFVIPTGNRPTGKHLFEPVIGNGHFYEAGVGLSAHGIVWENIDDSQEMAFYLECWFTHMIVSTQIRSFDLKLGDNSRYMLALNMTDDIIDGLSNEAGKEPDFQFNNVYAPVANLTTMKARISVPWKADLAVVFNYKRCNWEFDLGLDYWLRQPEHIKGPGKGCGNPVTVQTWALKGDAQMFGFREDNHDAVPLSATEINATIHEGTNSVKSLALRIKTPQVIISPIDNPGVDNPVPAFAQLGTVELLDSDFSEQINTSFQPVLLANKNIAHCRASTEGLSYGVFLHINYVWRDEHCWYTPYLGLGGKVEIAPDGPENTCPSVCTSNAIPNSLCGFCDEEVRLQANASQWTIWLKGGIRFN